MSEPQAQLEFKVQLEPREQGQLQLIFKFFQLRAHLLGLNHSTQKLSKLLLLVVVEVVVLDK
jgi:hypothetical protein